MPRQLARPPLQAPAARRLYATTDGGRAVDLEPFDRDWADAADGFLRHNGAALRRLDVRATIEPARRGVRVRLLPGSRAGAVPLRLATSGQVFSGLVVRPRFGWAGMGQVLAQTGWQAAPDLLPLPLVPGSGREVPPWVIAGPALRRLRELLGRLRRGYRMAEAVLPQVRGHVQWTRYAAEQLTRGEWHRFPCRFPDLAQDPRLRAQVRWALERLHRALAGVAGSDRLALALAEEALALLTGLADVAAQRPGHPASGGGLLDPVVEAGLEALGWVSDDRGLGGAAELDGLAWASALDALWERFVEAQARRWAAALGGCVTTARERTALVPVRWQQRGGVSLGHLAPDVVVRVGRQVVIFDAKYKAHLAGLDAEGWRAFTEDEQAAHRADLHQALAYAALFDAEAVTTVLVYPLRAATWRALADERRAALLADVATGGRPLRLALAGLPFGWGAGDDRQLGLWAWRGLLAG